jgi:hypothetical protein
MSCKIVVLTVVVETSYLANFPKFEQESEKKLPSDELHHLSCF